MKIGSSGLRIGVAIWILAGAGSGCERAPESPQKPQAPAAPVETVEQDSEPVEIAQEEEKEVAGPPEGPLIFASWPGREELHTFELMWLGGEREVELLEAPDPEAAVSARASWMDTEEIVWEDTRVRVEAATLYRVEGAREVAGLAYDEAFEELDAEEVHLELEDGELLALYQYAGEGTCFVGARGQVLLSECPAEGVREVRDEDPAEGSAVIDGERRERWRPRSQQWWAKVRYKGSTGWMRVDNAPVEVHIRLIEGYD